MRGKELVKSYQWLIEGIKPYCDEVYGELSDYDNSYGVVASVGAGDNRMRHGIRCQYFFRDDEEPHYYSLNEQIALGKLSEADAIEDFKHRIQAGQ